MPIVKIRGYGLFVVLLIAGIMAGCGPKDVKIGSEVQGRVAAAAPGITAAVKDGVVTLSGQVDSDAAKSKAEQTAREVKGVKNVVNNLTVKPAPVAVPDKAPAPAPVPEPAPVATPDKAPAPLFEADDAKIKNAVTANMKKYGVTGINVKVQNGEVKLTGDIKRAKLKDAMKAANEAKPKKVVNEMTVK